MKLLHRKGEEVLLVDFEQVTEVVIDGNDGAPVTRIAHGNDASGQGIEDFADAIRFVAEIEVGLLRLPVGLPGLDQGGDVQGIQPAVALRHLKTLFAEIVDVFAVDLRSRDDFAAGSAPVGDRSEEVVPLGIGLKLARSVHVHDIEIAVADEVIAAEARHLFVGGIGVDKLEIRVLPALFVAEDVDEGEGLGIVFVDPDERVQVEGVLVFSHSCVSTLVLD